MPAFLTPIDLTRNELRNAALQSLGTEPASPVVGQFYWDTALGKPRIWSGSAWLDMTGNVGTITAVTASAPLSSSGGATPNITIADATTSARGAMTAADKTKLDGVATGATANQSDAHLLARGNHTGTQLHTTISDFDTGVRENRLDQMAAPTTALALNAQKITGLADGTASTDAATFGQLSSAIQGFDWKAPVRVAATTNVATLSGLLTIDGVTLVAGERVLLAGQTSAAANGIYVAASGAWARAADADAPGELNNATVFVEAGTTGAGDVYTQTATIATVGTTAQTWVKSAEGNTVYTAGTGLTLTGTAFSISNGGVGATQLASAVAGNGLTGGAGSALAVGAGTGITVAATSVGIDTSVVARKYSADVGGATSVVLTHNLNTRDVQVTLREVAAPYAQVYADVEMTTVNTVTIRFATAPAAAAYRATIVG